MTERGEIKLIDYDGMIVPDSIGLDNNEIGHRHYQHPSRKTDAGITLNNFDDVDNFSCHVIGLSLLAVAVDASLWKQTQAGEENLLFRDSDYLAPDKSQTLAKMAEHEDERVRAVAQTMRDAIRVPAYFDVPPFDHSPRPVRTSFGQVRSWVLSHMHRTRQRRHQRDHDAASLMDFDYLEPVRLPADFSAEFILHEPLVWKLNFNGHRSRVSSGTRLRAGATDAPLPALSARH